MKGDLKDFDWRKVSFFVALALIILGGWYFFFSYENCSSWECFNAGLERCDRVRFIGGSDMIFEYAVKGFSEDACEVDVKLLQGKLNNQDSLKLEGSEMTCMLPRGVVMIPESDIGLCHGMLKEGLQDLVIRKLHSYLVQNLGKLNLEMADLPSVDSV